MINRKSKSHILVLDSEEGIQPCLCMKSHWIIHFIGAGCMLVYLIGAVSVMLYDFTKTCIGKHYSGIMKNGVSPQDV